MKQIEYVTVNLVDGSSFHITAEENERLIGSIKGLVPVKTIVATDLVHTRTGKFLFWSYEVNIPQYANETHNPFMVDSLLLGYKSITINIANICSITPGRKLYTLYQDETKELHDYI